jgi:putative ATPase
MEYKPSSPAQFIGSARLYASMLATLAEQLKRKKEPVRILLIGPPGTGKTSSSEFFLKTLGVGKWSMHKYNGTEMKIDEACEIARSFRMPDLLGEFRALAIEEVDAVPVVAQTRLLTLLDEMTAGSVAVCTSNCSVEQLEPRFQSRFRVFEFKPPTQQEIIDLLVSLGTPKREAVQIGTFCCGDVRLAINDASNAILRAQCMAVAA